MKPSRPYVIGLTGGIASGKSTLADALRAAGAPVIDADRISHGLTQPGGLALPALRAAFGGQVFDGEALNRAALAQRVFGDAQARDRLNDIMHPLILERIEREMQGLQQQPAVIWDVPLLFETGWDRHCDEVWCAWTPVWVQVRRIMRRDGMSLRQAWRRIASQMSGRERRSRSHYIIDTTGTKAASARRALALWTAALRKAQRGS